MDEFVRLLIPLFSLFIIIALGLRMIMGKDAFDQMVGTLAADIIRFLFLFPFRVLRWLARLFKPVP